MHTLIFRSRTPKVDGEKCNNIKGKYLIFILYLMDFLDPGPDTTLY